MALEEIIENLGFPITRCERLSGGDINESFCIQSNATRYFMKWNMLEGLPGFFTKEAIGLRELCQQSSFKIPNVINSGSGADFQYLLLEWIEIGDPQPDFWKKFATDLAEMHHKQQPYFGFSESNYLGTWKQDNTPAEDWPQFYASSRILPLVEHLFDHGKLNKQGAIAAENFCNQLSSVFPKEPPALVHGDLWSGNFMIASTGVPCLIDPAVYYGHREMDIGMTKLFGGFDDSLYIIYNEVYPLEKGWEQRVSFCQLYPLLLHAHLFSGSYIASVKSILAPFSII